jgi:DNA-binding transcriptional MerR regulator
MTTAELAERAGTTKRTIRYYLAEGLLPPAGGTSARLEFQREHEIRLRLIQYLQDAGIKLAAVKGILHRYSLQEIEGLVEAFDRGEHPSVGDLKEQPPGNGAILREGPLSLLYGTVRESRLTPFGPSVSHQGLQEETEAPVQGSSIGGSQGKAPPDPEATLHPEGASRAGEEPPVEGAAAAAAPAPAPAAEPNPGALPSPPETSDLWHRIRLAEEVEMLVRAPLDPQRKPLVEEVVAYGLQRLASRDLGRAPTVPGSPNDIPFSPGGERVGPSQQPSAHNHPSPGGDSAGQITTPKAKEETP